MSLKERRRKAADRASRWYYNNREKMQEYGRKHYRKNKLRQRDQFLKKKFGLTLVQFNALAVAQKNRCAICGGPPSGRSQKCFSVDHCHATGIVRGLLCGLCNVGLGAFKDNPASLQQAIKYLNKPRNPV